MQMHEEQVGQAKQVIAQLPVLTEDVKRTPVAMKLLEAVSKRLDNLRVSNDIRQSHDETEYTRGRIAETKLLISWLTPVKEKGDLWQTKDR